MYRYDRPRVQVDNRISIGKLFLGALSFVAMYFVLLVVTI